MSEMLRLRAQDAEDLAVIAALLQDARIPIKEMAFLTEEKRFVGCFKRYQRELQEDWSSCDGLTECLSAAVFERIEAVKFRGVDVADKDRELSLLTIATAPGTEHLIHIDLVFEGGAEIQLRTDAIAVQLNDFGESQRCRQTPCDHFAQMSYEDMAGHAPSS